MGQGRHRNRLERHGDRAGVLHGQGSVAGPELVDPQAAVGADEFAISPDLVRERVYGSVGSQADSVAGVLQGVRPGPGAAVERLSGAVQDFIDFIAERRDVIGPDTQGPSGGSLDELGRDFAVRGRLDHMDRTGACEGEVGEIVALPAQWIEDEVPLGGPFFPDPCAESLAGVFPKGIDIAEEAGGAVALPGRPRGPADVAVPRPGVLEIEAQVDPGLVPDRRPGLHEGRVFQRGQGGQGFCGPQLFHAALDASRHLG